MPNIIEHPSLIEFLNLYFLTIISFFCAALIFTTLGKWQRMQCVQQAPWWLNCSIKTDIVYVIINPVVKIYMRLLPVAVIILPFLIFMKPMQIYSYLVNGYGPLGRLSSISQCIIFVISVDFLSYWSHRIFHKKYLWPIHMIHHAPHDVDWTTAYRFHPLNLALGSWLVASILFMMGISPDNIIPATLLEAMMAYFVHSNLKITLGPFKYFVATPVFHRWHHTHVKEGGASNYGAIFSFWDVVFGTFYFPKNRLPTKYGIENCEIRENYVTQILYPFKKWYLDILEAYNSEK